MASNSFFHDGFGARPPLFNGEEYFIWKQRMQIFIEAYDWDVWDAIENGPFVPTRIVNGLKEEIPKSEWTDDDKKMVHPSKRANHYIACALSESVFCFVMHCETAKEKWDALQVMYEGTDQVKRARISTLTGDYEHFRMKHSESIQDMQKRFTHIVSHLASLGKTFSNEDLFDKVLRSLSRSWQATATAIVKPTNLSSMTFTMTLATLFGKLQHYELRFNLLDEVSSETKNKSNKVTSHQGRKETSSVEHF